MKYGTLPNGTTIISPINAGISQYNAYTKGCAPGGNQYGKMQFGQPVCGATTTGVAAAPCYTQAGAPDATCKPKDIANPILGFTGVRIVRPERCLSAVFDLPRAGRFRRERVQLSVRRDAAAQLQTQQLSITPSLQFRAGNRYGAPLTTRRNRSDPRMRGTGRRFRDGRSALSLRRERRQPVRRDQSARRLRAFPSRIPTRDSSTASARFANPRSCLAICA